MTEQRLSAQNPRELTANEWDQVTGGASDNFFPARDSPGLLNQGRTTTGVGGSPFTVTTVTGSTVQGNGGSENTGTPRMNGATIVTSHFPNS
jgi:hypothetical protein